MIIACEMILAGPQVPRQDVKNGRGPMPGHASQTHPSAPHHGRRVIRRPKARVAMYSTLAVAQLEVFWGFLRNMKEKKKGRREMKRKRREKNPKTHNHATNYVPLYRNVLFALCF